MATEGATATRARPIGARPLDRLTESDAEALGDEARDLAILARAGVPIARGWVVALDADGVDVAAFLAERAGEPLGKDGSATTCVKLRPWVRRTALAPRARPRFPATEDILDPSLLAERVPVLLAEVRASRAGPGVVRLRAIHCDAGPSGAATSIDAADGDPAKVSVWSSGARPYRFDRKTMRTLEEGGGDLPLRTLERIADLVDRAHLALGRPVEIDWVLAAGRPVIARVRTVQRAWRFTENSWRVVELLWHDEGPIAPLSVDGLDKALREEEDAVDEPRVRRLFARAYRRVDPGRGRRGERRQSFAQAAARVARVVADVTTPISAARGFTRTLDDRLRSFDRDDLARMDEADLAKAVRERQHVVVEAYELLDRGRQATAAVLGAIEAALGAVPRDCVHGLATIRRTRARRRIDERLQRAYEDLGDLPTEVDPVPAGQRRFFADLRRELADKRPLGLDLRPLAYGASDAALVEGMRAVRDGRAERAEREQRGAIRRLMATARARPLGRGRAALARTLTLVIERLAIAKGEVAEGLADANLRLREVALEVGRRLVERGVLDEDDDALYLYVSEIQDALSGEPGAYTARVRLRREEDARWRSFEPPTRLPPRHRVDE
ncbi:MAG: hypothetical protein H6719_00670 [Sandaracinaceae bacterium]|nr:hypothetical protein [Sandaracinaceae bacterium]